MSIRNIKLKNLFLELLSEDRYRIIRHMGLVVILLFLAVLNVFDFYNGLGLFYAFAITLALFSIPIYVNLYIFIPKFLIKKKISLYIILLILIILLDILFMGSFFFSFNEKYSLKSDLFDLHKDHYSILSILNAIIAITLFVAGTTSLDLFRRWMKYDLQIAELENTTMQSELQQLKNQINPHFLFNMLNNANILVKVDPDGASMLLTKLDDLLQYQFNDSTRNEVYLSADIVFLNSFLELEKVRRDNFEFVIATEGDIDNVKVPPLLFIPFVENAVKHNPDSDNLSYVHLSFWIQDQDLYFICKNSKPAIPIKKEQGGLGLSNIKRRLDLLYGENYSLEFTNAETTYTVNLHLKL